MEDQDFALSRLEAGDFRLWIQFRQPVVGFLRVRKGIGCQGTEGDEFKVPKNTYIAIRRCLFGEPHSHHRTDSRTPTRWSSGRLRTAASIRRDDG